MAEEGRIYTGREFVDKWNNNGGLVGIIYDNRGKIGFGAGAVTALVVREYLPKMVQAYQVGSARATMQAFREVMKESGLVIAPAAQIAQATAIPVMSPVSQLAQPTFSMDPVLYKSLLETLSRSIDEKFESMKKELQASQAPKV